MYCDLFVDAILSGIEKRLGGAAGKKVESDMRADAADELEDEINADIDKMIEWKRFASEMIESLDDDREKIILYKRYFEKKSFEQISVDTNYSWRQVHRLHGRALVVLENKYKDVIECHM